MIMGIYYYFWYISLCRTLVDTGIPEKQAKAQAEALRDTLSASDMVTKQYLTAEIEKIKADILKWISRFFVSTSSLNCKFG